MPARNSVSECVMVEERAEEGIRKSRAGRRSSLDSGWAQRVRAGLATELVML